MLAKKEIGCSNSLFIAPAHRHYCLHHYCVRRCSGSTSHGCWHCASWNHCWPRRRRCPMRKKGWPKVWTLPAKD